LKKLQGFWHVHGSNIEGKSVLAIVEWLFWVDFAADIDILFVCFPDNERLWAPSRRPTATSGHPVGALEAAAGMKELSSILVV